eukprot:s1615_g1.t1
MATERGASAPLHGNDLSACASTGSSSLCRCKRKNKTDTTCLLWPRVPERPSTQGQVHRPSGYAVSMNRFSRTSKTQTSPLARLWITMEGEASSEPACDPCLFFFSRRGCTKGSACGYCHFDHSHLQRARRPRRRARERYKRSVLQLLHSQVDLEQIHDELQESSRKNPYLRNFFQEFLDKPDDEQAEATKGKV